MQNNTPVLELKGITKTFTKNSLFKKEKTEVLKGVNMLLQRGQTLALIGPSGCGKTTIIKIILGLEKQDSGKVFIMGKDTATLTKKEFQKTLSNIGVVFQDPFSALDPRQTVESILSEPFLINKKPFTKQILEHALEEVSLEKTALNKYPHQFSGGQCQRINIARALILKPKLIIADEPTSALDVSIQAQIINLLIKMRSKYKFSLLFISHNLALCKYLCHNIVLVKQGTLNQTTGDKL
ncbi:MAG: dipeptide/oligopeptide/nickel ABC transporter ATP-binding protein [Elusimicrobiaceae bacterium]|nr:dipeptide/oligopeptide/nickel ABC transporter ATP-binding protein [Elusimicrobiaceae bacterium]